MRHTLPDWRPVVLVLMVTVTGSLFGAGADAQAKTETVSVFSERPLSDALLELEKRHRWVVTYEDAYYEYQADLVDFSHEVRNANRPTPPIWFAPHRTLTLDYRFSEIAAPEAVLARLVQTNNLFLLDYEYRLLRQGMWFHVVPAASKNAKGQLTPRGSRLDALVTIPNAERSVEGLIGAVIQAANKVSGTNIVFGMGPKNVFTQTRVRTGAQNESARNVLIRALEATGRRVTWHLLCTFEGLCGLNFRVIE